MLRLVLNVAGCQCAWLACVLGAAAGQPESCLVLLMKSAQRFDGFAPA